MRIALLGNNYPPEFRGGTERVMEALARELVTLGEDVIVICGSERGIHDREVIESPARGIPVFRLPRAHDPSETYGVHAPRPRIRAHVQRLLGENDIEVLHLHHWSHLSDDLLRMARAEGIPGVCTLHDMWTSCVRFFRQPPRDSGITCPTATDRESCVPCLALDYGGSADDIRDQLARRDGNIRGELGAAAAVTAPSESCANAIRQRVAFDLDVQVIPHGLLETVTRTVPRERRGQLPFCVGTFGNLGPEKGVTDLLHAMAGLDGAELCIFGHCPNPDYPVQLAAEAAALGVTLHIHGAYDHHDGIHPAEQMDLAVFFSHCEETYGLVVEEALAHGRPVIVSDRGALPERTRCGGGVVVSHRDTAALRHHIRRLIEDPRAFGELSEQIPGTFATMKDTAARYRDLYADALARK